MADRMIMQIATGYTASRVLHTFTELGIADIMAEHGEPMTAAEMVPRIGAEYDPRPLFRMLRFVASLGIVDMHDGPLDNLDYHQTFKFQLNEASQLLRKDSPLSLRDAVLWRGGDDLYKLWGSFGESVRTGSSAAKIAFGTDSFWDYLQQHQKSNDIFDRAMSSNTKRQEMQVLSSYDFSGVSSVVDVGGGVGTLLFAVLDRYPDIRKGHLFEIASVVEKVVVPDHLKDRVEVHVGSFLHQETLIPVGADLYLMKHIIHDWADEEAQAILKAVSKAMTAQSKALVIEFVIPSGNSFSMAKAMDLHMMVTLGAKERTAEEYRQLLGSAGLKMTQVLGQHVNIIESILNDKT